MDNDTILYVAFIFSVILALHLFSDIDWGQESVQAVKPPAIDDELKEKFPWRQWRERPAPLVIRGGDPVLRAFMRTITVVESNSARPYNILYGGSYVEDLHHHPDRCIRIRNGPERGNCTTAAGRYQVLRGTWGEIADRYHPNTNQDQASSLYDFSPGYQDMVVHRWLQDSAYWGCDLSDALESRGLKRAMIRCPRVVDTWPSLPGGDQPNVLTSETLEVFEDMLTEERRNARR